MKTINHPISSKASTNGRETENKSNYASTRLLVLFFATFFLSSCERYLDVGLPRTQLPAQSVFSSDATATAVLATVYQRAGDFASGGAGSTTQLSAYMADETDSYNTLQALVELSANQPIASNTYTTGLWNACYTVIYQTNILIEGVTGNPKLSTKVADRLRGEALFLRAYAHLTLASYYGAVPIALSSDYLVNAKLGRSELPAVYAQAISDLKQAKALLADTYASYNSERIGANRWTASALLARAYLYSGDYPNAKAESSLLIASPLFALPALHAVFLKNSTETILSYRPAASAVATPEGIQFILTGRPATLALSTKFMGGFEDGDARKTAWTGKVTASGSDYFFPYKYRSRTGTTLTEYSVILRLAEQYLIRAEACARMDERSQAIADLDALRQRAVLPKIASTNPGIGQAALLEAVLQERRSELFTEWNHRWVDLQRFGKATTVLPLVKPDWKPHVQLLPIPEADLRNNPNLRQNPGYQ